VGQQKYSSQSGEGDPPPYVDRMSTYQRISQAFITYHPLAPHLFLIVTKSSSMSNQLHHTSMLSTTAVADSSTVVATAPFSLHTYHLFNVTASSPSLRHHHCAIITVPSALHRHH
jgi:hypothetical protein